MTKDKGTQDPLDHVNASGFPFQRRVAHEITATANEHECSVEASEVPWIDPETDALSFVDLVIGMGEGRLIVECKRRSGGSWIFLPRGGATLGKHFYYLSTSEGRVMVGEQGVGFAPSVIADACIVPGSREKRRLLEVDAARLVRATEALAAASTREVRDPERPSSLHFVPVLVTNLPLLVCHFEAGAVSLDDGTVGDARMEEVPFLRFTKSFAREPREPGRPVRDYADLVRDRERTVFVVQAAGLADFLKRSFSR